MRSNIPFFSVIIPTFNRSKTLNRSISSVMKQSFKDFELIIVDDGSTDNTREICHKYDLNYIKTENHGVSYARNTGAKSTRGKWLAFLDSDDEWLPNKLKKQKDFIRDNPEYSIVHGNERWINNGSLLNQKLKHKKSGGNLFNKSLELCLISPSAVAIHRDLFSHYRGFREDFPVCEDYDLWLKITSNNEVGFIEDEILIKYGGHKDQLSQKFRGMDYWRVLSIDWVVENLNLTSEKKEAATSQLVLKSKILLNGYIKHKNLSNHEEISKILAKYLNRETKSDSASKH